jgi:hypothetical protein
MLIQFGQSLVLNILGSCCATNASARLSTFSGRASLEMSTFSARASLKIKKVMAIMQAMKPMV